MRSTARQGAVSIRNKHGDLYQSRPIGVEIPLARMAFMVRSQRLYARHECDFSPLFDGSKTLICSCGAVQVWGETY